jgi:hypothetical protein
MNAATIQLDAGGLLLTKAKVETDATEQIVARAYRHPALGDRPVIRLASDRLGQAEDLAMEFLGFEAPAVSAPLALQQRRSLGFAAWALINDPANARFALDLVKSMKAAARQARSKPGHAWDAYTVMATELGRSARHFLPPFWEEAGRTFKDLGNQTYAGRALNKSLEAERVHALDSDRARRRDVVLEFVLAGCLTGNALSEYSADLQSHYAPQEAFEIFRDLCVRRTRGGMPPWASLPKDFTKLAKAAQRDGDQELEKWLEEIIEAPAMGRAPYQFWKTCGAHCKRIVARNPAFAVALLRHTRPEPRFYGESKLEPCFALLEEWGVLEFLWKDEHRGAPPLGEPVADWFGRIVRDEFPARRRTLEMLEKLATRLKKENVPLALSIGRRHGANPIDIDVLEACLRSGIKVGDPPPGFTVTFSGWLSANVDHSLRNQDVVESAKDERFKAAIIDALDEALACRGGTKALRYGQAPREQRAFTLAASDRPGIKELWRLHTSSIIATLEQSALVSFEMARNRLASTLWPDTLRLFPDLAQRLKSADPVAMLERTLQSGVFDEYGFPALEETVDQERVTIQFQQYGNSNIHLTFPSIVVFDKIHAVVVGGDGMVKKYELHLPNKCAIVTIAAVGNDLAVNYRDEKHQGHFYWVSDPAQHYDAAAWAFHGAATQQVATVLEDGSVFLGQQTVRSGDKQMPQSQPYVHDGERFWRITNEYDQGSGNFLQKITEVNPRTGKPLRESVPAWFEETEGGTLELDASDLRPAPAGALDSPLGAKNGMLGWRAVKRRDGGYFGVGIDGRRWDKPLIRGDGTFASPWALVRQPGTQAFLPVTTAGARAGHYWLWDPTGSTVIAALEVFGHDYARGQVALLPLKFWHFLRVRDLASSQKLRRITHAECVALFAASAANRQLAEESPRRSSKQGLEGALTNLLPAVKKLLPTAPERMVMGIARLVERAERESAAFDALRNKASAGSTKETTSTSLVANRKADIAASHWGMQPFNIYRLEETVLFSEHLAAAAEFLKGTSQGGDLPRTNYLWFSMLEDLPLRCWQTLWRALAAKMTQKNNSEVPWLEFLKLWRDLGIAELPGQFAIMEGKPEREKKQPSLGFPVAVAGGTSFAIENGEDRFIVVEGQYYHHVDALPCHILRYSTAKTPGAPPGYEFKNLRKVTAKYDRAEITAFIAAVESSTKPPLPSREELTEIAGKLSASPAEIALVWLGGLKIDSYEHNFLPGELRTALGLKTTDASAGRQALRNFNPSVQTHLYEAVVSQGCAAPFAADRGLVLRSIEKAWQAKMPKRLQLDAALQTRLSALSRKSQWQQVNHEALLAAAADPAKHPLLQPREIEIKADKKQRYQGLGLAAKNGSDPVIAGDSLRSILQLVSLVHAETAAGNPARAEMPALITQTTTLLGNSTTMLALRAVFLYGDGRKEPLKPSEWVNRHVGKTKETAHDGTARFDDGLIAAAAIDGHHYALVGYRPAKLKDRADLARLRGILAVDAQQDPFSGDGFLSVVAAIKSPGFQELARAILAKNVPEGQWPQNPNHTAPAVLKAIRTKCKLGEDAASLYAQLLAVPNPTAANIREWNGWTAAQLQAASAELVGRKLVLEAVRERASRSIFLPGEWLALKAPWLPIESWKLAHLVELDTDPIVHCPAGGPMVLRPFEDLFAAAWQRVVDGDAPRYEEVKRRKKAK